MAWHRAMTKSQVSPLTPEGGIMLLKPCSTSNLTDWLQSVYCIFLLSFYLDIKMQADEFSLILLSLKSSDGSVKPPEVLRGTSSRLPAAYSSAGPGAGVAVAGDLPAVSAPLDVGWVSTQCFLPSIYLFHDNHLSLVFVLCSTRPSFFFEAPGHSGRRFLHPLPVLWASHDLGGPSQPPLLPLPFPVPPLYHPRHLPFHYCAHLPATGVRVLWLLSSSETVSQHFLKKLKLTFMGRPTSKMKLFLSYLIRELHMMDTTNWHKMRGGLSSL